MRMTPLEPQVQADSLQALLRVEAAEWVELHVKTLESEGRLIEGGWPGTISEARRRVVGCLAVHPQDAASKEELAVLVDTIYSEAKRLWLVERS